MNITLVPGETWPDGSKMSIERLRRAAKPAVSVEGLLSSVDISNDAVKAIHLKSEAYFWATGDADANNVVALTLANAPADLATGLMIRWRAMSAKDSTLTLNLNAKGAKRVLRVDGTPLQTGDIRSNQVVEVVYAEWADSPNGAWLMTSAVGGSDTYYAVAVNTNNNYNLSLDPAPASLVAGLSVRFKVDATNTAGPTLSIGGGSQAEIKRADGSALVAGEFLQNMIVDVVYDGTYWRLSSPMASRLGFVYGADGTASDSYNITIPGIGSLVEGLKILFKANTGNTGAAELQLNGLGFNDIRRSDGSVLATGDIKASEIVEVTYTTYWGWLLTQRRRVFRGQENVLTTAGVIAAQAHNLGRSPDAMFWWLKCLTADSSSEYAAGDMVPSEYLISNGGIPLVTPWADATSVGAYLAYDTGVTTYYLRKKTGVAPGSLTVITPSSWRLVCHAEVWI